MFFHEKTYDIDELARWNLHLHTNFSRCAKPEMNARDIVRAADAAGLEMIALTDHNSPHKPNAVAQQRYDLMREIDGFERNVKVLIGAELSSYGINKFADDIACDNSLDYRLYTTNHYHQDYWEHPEEKLRELMRSICLRLWKALLQAAEPIALRIRLWRDMLRLLLISMM